MVCTASLARLRFSHPHRTRPGSSLHSVVICPIKDSGKCQLGLKVRAVIQHSLDGQRCKLNSILEVWTNSLIYFVDTREIEQSSDRPVRPRQRVYNRILFLMATTVSTSRVEGANREQGHRLFELSGFSLSHRHCLLASSDLELGSLCPRVLLLCSRQDTMTRTDNIYIRVVHVLSFLPSPFFMTHNYSFHDTRTGQPHHNTPGSPHAM
jgi:hypothetical protein